MSTTFALDVTFTQVDCGECGGVYAINERFRKQCEDHGKSWTCPYCKVGWGFANNGRLQKLEKELAAEQARHDQTRASLRNTEQELVTTEKRRRAEKGAKTRLKNRIGAGTCPCCDQQFPDLAAHLQEQHPDFQAAIDADEPQTAE